MISLTLFKRAQKRNDTALSSEIMGERSSIFDLARGRLSLLGTAFIVLYIIVAARVVDLSVVQGTLLQIKDANAVEKAVVTENMRGNIYDRNGVLLATTLKTKSLFVDASVIENPQQVLGELNKIIPNLSQKKTLAALSSGARFEWVARDVTPEQQSKIMMIGEPALGFQDAQRRVYPQGHLAAHLLGYTDIDGKGLSGLERSFDEHLDNGEKSLHTTLDIRLQHAMNKELAATMDEFKAQSATGIIMNVKTGALLAGGSLPYYDLNKAGEAGDNERFNRMTLGVYELGSIFKIFSTAALLNEGAGMGREFDARKPLKAGRFSIRDYHAEKRIMSVPEVFMYSSNIGSALMGQTLGNEKIQKYYRDLGLLDKPNFSIKEVGNPLKPSPWRDINTLTASYGHGIAVSPLQLGAAVATSVGDGTRVHPYLVASTDKHKTDIRVFKEDTALKMRRLLRLNALEGTGKNALVSGYEIGGKTGTADKPKPSGGYYNDKKISSFVSIFPAQDPEYVVLVVVDDPVGHKGTYGYATGGWVAAPAAGRIVEHMVRILGIKPVATEENSEFVEPLLEYIESDDKLARAN